MFAIIECRFWIPRYRASIVEAATGKMLAGRTFFTRKQARAWVLEWEYGHYLA